MTTIRNIFDTLCAWAPLELQMDFDNSGLLVGRGDRPVRRVLLSLDITAQVIDEAAELGAELIVSHHPVIFHPLKSLTDGAGELPLLLAERGIAAVCMHTNLDIAEGGVNDVLLRLLGAEPEGPLDAEGCGRVGTLAAPLPLSDFLAGCKARLQVPGLRYVDGGKPVERLAVLGGAGGGEWALALEKGCDTFVTADVKYHDFLQAAAAGLNLIDADHYCTEYPVIPMLARRLSETFPELEFRISRRHGPVIRFV